MIMQQKTYKKNEYYKYGYRVLNHINNLGKLEGSHYCKHEIPNSNHVTQKKKKTQDHNPYMYIHTSPENGIKT